MGDDTSKIARDRFYVARAEALNWYASVEQGLAFMFATALATNPRYATLIISKMINTRARNEVVQRIVDWHTGKRFRAFTNSLFTIIGNADTQRNQLVHWRVKARDKGGFALIPADILSDSDDAMDESEIGALSHKCFFLAAVTGAMSRHMKDWASDPALHERFQQPLHYPPERGDLLFRYRIDSGVPPEPSLA